MAMCKVSSSVHFVTRSVTSREGAAKAHWVPNTDVYATDNGLVIKVELAGMRSEHLEITVEGNRLRISGTRPDGCRAAKCSFLVMEINYGPFESVLELPPGYDLSQAKAAYLNGFLRIDVPLAPRHAKSARVPIAEGN
jgi:HSP20 family protein